MGGLGSRGKFFMQHILDGVSTTTVDLGPEVLEDFWKWLIEEVGDDLDGLD